ncbi:aminodeoxychorismate lyase [Paenibacillus oleatilyticus]|uniref:aminodeoxychorismate lyase n=1 Tax=Paenibacillus oleatilyticus TaxID=2594886 RepID=UPI001C1F7D02|nr:aminodeoxychorismate lyase [Paenibacillus oleatilyticus]MBU7320907.1 aminodeoxychorismate lyase [Paenibacillus oleatilyticus]
MKIDLNGNVIEEQKAVVSVYDHGFLYGMGLFETFRTYGGRPFLLEWHLERLAAGCRELDIRYVPDPEGLQARIHRLLEANELTDAYFRFTITAGTDILGLPAEPYKHPTEILYVKALPPVDSSVYNHGKPLQLLESRRNSPEGAIRHKSLHYMNNILAKQELRRYSWAAQAEGLLLDAQGFLSEGIVSNVFFVRGGELHTPAVETGLLPGITRRYVMTMARETGLSVSEGLYRWEELTGADEVFLTNSIQEIVPVTGLFDREGNAHTVGDGTAGPVTAKLLSRYRNACSELVQ